MIYTVEEYRQRFHPTKSAKSVIRLIKSNMIPTCHQCRKLGNCYVINVITFSEYQKVLSDSGQNLNQK